MTIVKRLRLLTAILGGAAVTAAIGTTVFGEIRAKRESAPAAPIRTEANVLADDLARNSFAAKPALTYKNSAGQAAFAWQLKPTATPARVRDRDIMVLVDTSASQAGLPLNRARNIIDGLAQSVAETDRIDVWTINLNDPKATRSMTEGFKPARSEAVTSASARLVETEYAAGATDLKVGLERAMAAFEPNPGRNQVILFLGDGESSASLVPLNEAIRVELGGKMDQQNIAFFAVPLGIKVNANNLHGFATLTGGAVVRLTEDTTTIRGQSTFATQLRTAIDVPIVKVTKVTYSNEAVEVFPTRLPPLRADRATLVVGSLKSDAASITAKVEGIVAGQPVTMELAERLPPSDSEHYFLHAMIEQWRSAPVKDAPAILAADRALALAAQQFRLFREEFLTQAVSAISTDRLDHAEKLYQAAVKIDPTSKEAEAGMKVIVKMRTGGLTRQQMKAGLSDRNRLQDLSKEPAPGAKPLAPATPAQAASGLQQAQAEQAVQEQQYRVLVDETIRKARQLLATDPDTAYEDLKRQRDVVLSNTQLGNTYRAKLAADLESMMQTVSTQGGTIKRNLSEERERLAQTRLRVNEYARQQTIEEQTRSRIDSFKQLMNQARFELAQQEAQVLIQERTSRGLAIPVEATAAYMIGQAATNLREHRELVRIREDRYLLTMMQAEKSFIPYPDEPPVHFPPAAVWRELTSDRDKYRSSTLGSDVSPSMRRTQSIIDGPSAERVKIETELDGMALKDLISFLEKDHGLKFVVLEDEFVSAGVPAIMDKKLTLKQKLYGLTVGSFLDIALSSIGATYMVRPEYIEITTVEKRLKEKVVRAFDITELVYQIPSSINQAVLQQNQSVQSSNLSLFGQASFGGNAGNFNFGGGGFGGGGIGGIGGGLGGGGVGGAGGGGGQIQGGFGGGAANNLGAGGGVTGVGGGQVGQFGNLGGQFGIQGNSLPNYQLITTLITEVVARGEWATVNQQFNVTTGNGQPNEEVPKLLPEDQLNSLAFYPPTSALIVRATGKYHPQSSIKLKKAEGGAAGGPGNPARGANGNVIAAIAAAEPKPGDNAVVAVEKAKLKHAAEDVRTLLKEIDKSNPQRMWQQALGKSNVKHPGLVVACADFLFEYKEPAHAAEVLKSGIRHGLTTDAWTHEALAVALRDGKADSFEIQRVGMSGLDFEANDAKSYMKAAKIADENGNLPVALAYCQRAASIEPNMPSTYANALAYAEKSKDVQTDVIHWATENLLARDWSNEGVNYHAQTKERLGQIVEKFERANQPELVARFKKTLEQENNRELVIELRWQGGADLDLLVTEPSGSTASPTHKRTIGGGVVKADILGQPTDDRFESYTAAQAMSGSYTVKVKKSLGTPVGNNAKVVVTKFKGTPREATEHYTIDLSSSDSVQVKVDGGSRTELAVLPFEEPTATRLETTAAPAPMKTGFGGGISSNEAGPRVATGKTTLPVVIQSHESRLAGVTPNAPGMRATMEVTPDRKSIKVTATSVFTGIATDLPLPKVSLLPGSE